MRSGGRRGAAGGCVGRLAALALVTFGCDAAGTTPADAGADAGLSADGGLPVDGGPSPSDEAAERALDYLAVTELELGLDVVASMQIYARLKDHARAAAVAEQRRAGLRASELERYGVLLDVDKAPFEPSTLADEPSTGVPPDPDDTLGDDRSSSCLDEALECAPSATCLEFAELPDRGGYVLTHQAVFLLFARWMGCALPIDVEAARHRLGRRLVEEQAADPTPSDLFYERVAMLGHLGFATEIDPAWFEALVEGQQADGCFPLGPAEPCHPHPTGLALWALAHAD